MSETETSPTEEDSGGIFCQNCSPSTRKFGYYLTFLIGLIVFGFGVVQMIFNDVLFLIVGGFIILLCPLWIKSPSGCCTDLKNAVRLTSTLIFFVFLILTTICYFAKFSSILNYISGIGLGLSGIWYFLSYFPNGQKACVSCMKSCCSSEK